MNCETVITSAGSDIGLQTQQKLLTTEEPGSESRCVEKTQPKQCQYWVTGNCVQGFAFLVMWLWIHIHNVKKVRQLDGHTKRVNSVSLDGEIGCLVTEGPWLFAGLPNAVKAWNLQNQTEVSLNGPVGQVHCMASDSDILFAGAEDGTILVWKWHPGSNIPEPVAMLKGHNGAVCSLVIGANRLYSGSRDCTIRVWDLQTLQSIQVLEGHGKDVTSVLCWDLYLLSASTNNTLKVWAATESGTIEMIYPGPSPVRSFYWVCRPISLPVEVMTVSQFMSSLSSLFLPVFVNTLCWVLLLLLLIPLVLAPSLVETIPVFWLW